MRGKWECPSKRSNTFKPSAFFIFFLLFFRSLFSSLLPSLPPVWEQRPSCLSPPYHRPEREVVKTSAAKRVGERGREKREREKDMPQVQAAVCRRHEYVPRKICRRLHVRVECLKAQRRKEAAGKDAHSRFRRHAEKQTHPTADIRIKKMLTKRVEYKPSSSSALFAAAIARAPIVASEDAVVPRADVQPHDDVPPRRV